jgi:polyketide cyclase/dehydrase/lipid transport protein
MASFEFAVDSSLPAAAVLDAATDFSERRPHLWPNIDPRVYRVHSLAPGRAEVTEGSAALGGVWARESYDWSRPGIVRATVQESNIFHPGGTWELRATAQPGGGCRVEVSIHRQARGARGRLVGAMMTLGGRRIHTRLLEKTLAIVAGEAPDPILSA